jgi:hypothetical protein
LLGITATTSEGDQAAMASCCPPIVTVPFLVPNPVP